MQPNTLLPICVLLLLSTTVRAEPGTAPPALAQLSSVTVASTPAWLATHRALIQLDDALRGARAMRTAGIVILSVGVPLGLAVGAVGVAGANACTSASDLPFHDGQGCGGGLGVGIAGLVAVGVSLAIGLPLTAVGVSRIDKLERRRATLLLPRVGLTVGPQRARLTAAWRF